MRRLYVLNETAIIFIRSREQVVCDEQHVRQSSERRRDPRLRLRHTGVSFSRTFALA